MPETAFTLSAALNIALVLAGFAGAALLRNALGRLVALEVAGDMRQTQLTDLREELPTHYMRRDDFKQALDAITGSLRRIEDQMKQTSDQLDARLLHAANRLEDQLRNKADK